MFIKNIKERKEEHQKAGNNQPVGFQNANENDSQSHTDRQKIYCKFENF